MKLSDTTLLSFNSLVSKYQTQNIIHVIYVYALEKNVLLKIQNKEFIRLRAAPEHISNNISEAGWPEKGKQEIQLTNLEYVGISSTLGTMDIVLG